MKNWKPRRYPFAPLLLTQASVLKFHQCAGHVMIFVGGLLRSFVGNVRGIQNITDIPTRGLTLKPSQNCPFITLSWRGISTNISESWMTEVVLTQTLEMKWSPFDSPCMLGWDQGWMRLVPRLAKLANVGSRCVKTSLPVFHVPCMLFIRWISRKLSGGNTYFEVVHYEVMVQGRNVDEMRHWMFCLATHISTKLDRSAWNSFSQEHKSLHRNSPWFLASSSFLVTQMLVVRTNAADPMRRLFCI